VRHVICSSGDIVFFRFIGRASAWLLVALIALPFTAPFSACDLSMLLSPASHAPSAAIGRDGRAASIQQASAQETGGTCLDEEQFKDTIVTAVVPSLVLPVVVAPAVFVSTPGSAPRFPLLSLRL